MVCLITILGDMVTMAKSSRQTARSCTCTYLPVQMDTKTFNDQVTLVVKRSEPVRVNPVEPAGGEYYLLSNLDQNIAGIMKTVHLFSANSNKSSDSAGYVLRDALAKVLVHFYPLAGSLAVSLEGKLIVKCDGPGVPFVEATAECSLEDLGDISIPGAKLGELVYVDPEVNHVMEVPLLTVQVTRFRCGGFMVGLAMNHCMADGLSCVQFLNSWAETARNLPLSIPPFLDRIVLQPRHPPKSEFTHLEFDELKDESQLARLESEPHQYRSFIFDSNRLDHLKQMAAEDGSADGCTSFTALSAFIWRAWARSLKMTPRQKTKLLFAVDVRRRFKPPLPNGFFGNGIMLGCCLCEAGELQNTPLSFTAGLIRSAAQNMTDRYIRSAIDHFELNRARPPLTATLIISTWTKLEFTSWDFGWGEASQSGPAELPEKVALFLSRVRVKGTTVVIGLPASSMRAFQEMLELIPG